MTIHAPNNGRDSKSPVDLGITLTGQDPENTQTATAEKVETYVTASALAMLALPYTNPEDVASLANRSVPLETANETASAKRSENDSDNTSAWDLLEDPSSGRLGQPSVASSDSAWQLS